MIGTFLDYNVTRQHRADLVLSLKRPIRELWVTHSKNEIGMEVDFESSFEILFHVDLAEYFKAVPRQRLFRRSYCIVKSRGDCG